MLRELQKTPPDPSKGRRRFKYELFWYVFMRFSEITINNQNFKGNDSMTSLGSVQGLRAICM